MTDVSGIYAIVNTVNGKAYVGSSQWIDWRWKYHRYYLGRGQHHSPHLQSAWDKYGASTFEFKILESPVPVKDLYKREYSWIQELKVCNPHFGYNIDPNPTDRSEMSKETRRRMSEASRMEELRKGKTYEEIYGPERADEERRKRSEGNKGKTLSEETCRKIGEVRKGKTYEEIYGSGKAEEIKRRLSEAQRRRRRSEEVKG